MSSGAVARIIDFSPVDGPGNRLVIFLQGCNFNCHYCHNPETIPLAGQEDFDAQYPPVYQEMTVEQVVKRYLKAKPFISGVTFSGGECTVQFEFLLACCKALRAQQAHILIDTNGQISAEELRQLLPVIDGLMLDVKAIDPEQHRLLTGAGNAMVLQSFKEALQNGKLAEVRTVVRENEPDALETVAWVAGKLAEADPGIPYRIIRYRPQGVRKEMLPRLRPPSESLMAACRDIAVKAGLRQVIIL